VALYFVEHIRYRRCTFDRRFIIPRRRSLIHSPRVWVFTGGVCLLRRHAKKRVKKECAEAWTMCALLEMAAGMHLNGREEMRRSILHYATTGRVGSTLSFTRHATLPTLTDMDMDPPGLSVVLRRECFSR
jgi:hypothetical protein